MGREQEGPPSVSRSRQSVDDSSNRARSDADPRYALLMPEERFATKEEPRPTARSQTFHRANTHRYSLALPEIPARIRQEPSEDRSHPCAETPRGAAHRLPVRYGSTTEQARLDRVSSRKTEAQPT